MLKCPGHIAKPNKRGNTLDSETDRIELPGAGHRPSARPPTQSFRHNFLHVAVALAKMNVRRPLARQLATGRAIGRLGRRVLPAYAHVARVNLRTCFPELDAAAVERLLRGHFESVGMGFAEMAFAYFGDKDRIREAAEVHGLEHLEAARARGKGVILVTGHFTSMELTLPMLALQGVPMLGVYRPVRKNAVADRIMRAGRERFATGLIAREDLRGMMRALRANSVVVFLPDQLVKIDKRSFLIPFFGEPALTHTGLCNIAARSGAAVVPFLPLRIDADGRYELRLLPALEDFPSSDPAADMARINTLLEAHIRRDPRQYYWMRPRFQKRPPPYPDLYAR